MKSAYELAMERLNKVSPTVKLSEKQKQELADLDSEYLAKIADREIFLKGAMQKALEKGDMAEMEELQKQVANQKKTYQAELEEKKEQVRKRSGK
ncbi:MAG: hypothetical protein JNN07_17940 [Verrucomicrobiales bacterium]|jgi:hypothetical protein|nr:hypothetical protein [Verrucomicrobiales bacterium]